MFHHIQHYTILICKMLIPEVYLLKQNIYTHFLKIIFLKLFKNCYLKKRPAGYLYYRKQMEILTETC